MQSKPQTSLLAQESSLANANITVMYAFKGEIQDEVAMEIIIQERA
jgi:hypothetical protein